MFHIAYDLDIVLKVTKFVLLDDNERTELITSMADRVRELLSAKIGRRTDGWFFLHRAILISTSNVMPLRQLGVLQQAKLASALTQTCTAHVTRMQLT